MPKSLDYGDNESNQDDDLESALEEDADIDGEVPLAEIVNTIIAEESEKLGPISWAQGCIATLFGIAIVLWISREPGVPGWSRIMPSGIDEHGRSKS